MVSALPAASSAVSSLSCHRAALPSCGTDDDEAASVEGSTSSIFLFSPGNSSSAPTSGDKPGVGCAGDPPGVKPWVRHASSSLCRQALHNASPKLMDCDVVGVGGVPKLCSILSTNVLAITTTRLKSDVLLHTFMRSVLSKCHNIPSINSARHGTCVCSNSGRSLALSISF